MGNQYYDGDLSITDMTNPSGDPKAAVTTQATPTKNIPEWQLNSSKYPSDFILNLHTIYGDNELDKRTLKQLKRTWKKNPNFIINAALQKKNAANDAALQEATAQAQQNMKNITSKYWDDVYAMEDASAAQDEKDYMDAGYTYDINKGWTKPATPAPKAFNEKHWLGRAKQFGFNSIDEVKAWQQQNGLVADGMFGGNSEAKMLELQKAAENDPANNPYAGRMQGTTTRNAQQQAASNYKKPATSASSTTTNNTATSNTNSESKPGSWMRSAAKVFEGATGLGKGLNNMFNTLAEWRETGWLQRNDSRQPMYLQPGRTTANMHKNGGNINKFAGGGKQMNEQQMQEAFVQFLIQDAQAQGIDIQSEEDMKAYVQQLGKEGLAAKQQEFMQRMQGTPSRKLGGHLAYLNKLKGNCPDGEEMVYMENGGRVCHKCVKKAKDGDKAKKIDPKKNAISDFKEKRKAVNPNDTVHVGGKPKSLTNANGTRVDARFPAYTAKDYQNDKKTKDGQKRRMKADLVSSEKCGGKAKKNK